MRVAGFSFSRRSVASYAVDWVFLLVFGLICYGLNKMEPHYHPFSLVDLSISYPYVEELVSTTSLVVASIIGPAVIIILVALLLVPGPAASRRIPMRSLLARKVWEVNAGLLGLALSELTSLLLTTGMKSLFGKPRPNMLARCDPDLQAIGSHTVGRFAGNDISPAWVLVDRTICRQTDTSILYDAFRSFPSGHCSTSWAGLLYFSLYLCAKFGVAFPHLTHFQSLRGTSAEAHTSEYMPDLTNGTRSFETERKPIFSGRRHGASSFQGRRSEAAAPPVYTQLLLFIPIGVSIFICASRFFDYRHHGFDILSGSVIGIATSWFAFRFYHMPLSRGAGWSWGPRSKDRAFGIGVGTDGWVSEGDAVEEAPNRTNDVEMARLRTMPTSRPGTGTPVAGAQYDYHEQPERAR